VAEVKIQEGESIESALRRFKRKVQQEDIIKDIKKHSETGRQASGQAGAGAEA
jgi:ribosomal protein S21